MLRWMLKTTCGEQRRRAPMDMGTTLRCPRLLPGKRGIAHVMIRRRASAEKQHKQRIAGWSRMARSREAGRVYAPIRFQAV